MYGNMRISYAHIFFKSYLFFFFYIISFVRPLTTGLNASSFSSFHLFTPHKCRVRVCFGKSPNISILLFHSVLLEFLALFSSLFFRVRKLIFSAHDHLLLPMYVITIGAQREFLFAKFILSLECLSSDKTNAKPLFPHSISFL